MHARTCPRTQAQTYARKNEHKRVFFYFFKVFSIKTHPKHVLAPPKVSSFYLNTSHSKTQAFTSLKIDQNGISKEWLEKEKKNPHWSCPYALKKMLL